MEIIDIVMVNLHCFGSYCKPWDRVNASFFILFLTDIFHNTKNNWWILCKNFRTEESKNPAVFRNWMESFSQGTRGWQGIFLSQPWGLEERGDWIQWIPSRHFERGILNAMNKLYLVWKRKCRWFCPRFSRHWKGPWSKHDNLRTFHLKAGIQVQNGKLVYHLRCINIGYKPSCHNCKAVTELSYCLIADPTLFPAHTGFITP